MLIPLSWVKEYVDIKIPFAKLAERMSEVGLTIETWKEEDGDIIFDPEITSNRADWMSITGIAREIAVVTGASFSMPKLISLPKPKNIAEIKYKEDLKLCPRTSTLIVRNVKVKSSPEWLQKRIKQIGLRPINNLVDITNYVLWVYGNPLHVFDYDKIRGHQMSVEQAKGGEEFRSLDGINYKLPKDAIVIKDLGRVIDLLPLKGGENTSVTNETKNILFHSIVCDPVLTRRTSQTLGLRSDSSAVSERGVDPNGTTRAALKALELILELAGGEVASPLMEAPERPYPTWTVEMSHEKLEAILGIKISPKDVKNIFERLELKVEGEYKVTIPTFRNDVHIEEDVIEEVGRIYGYDNFPKTLPTAPTPTIPVAYRHDFDLDYQIKQILKGAGYSEIYTYSLISEKQLLDLGIDPGKALRVDNPISKDYEYLRPTLFGNLLSAYQQNQNAANVKLYELGKQYRGETCDKATEVYWLWAITDSEFLNAKGDLEQILEESRVNFSLRPATKIDNHSWLHPGRTAQIETEKKEYLGVIGEVHPSLLAKFDIKNKVIVWGLNVDLIMELPKREKNYQVVPKYPPVIEDLSLVIPEKVSYGETVTIIKETSKLVSSVDLKDLHESSTTLRLTYLDLQKNLTDREVAEVRNKILRNLREKLKVSLKE